MSVQVVGAEFTSRAGDRQLNVIAENEGYGRGSAARPKATDFPPDLVAAIRDWADAGLNGIHEDYRVPAKLVGYLRGIADYPGDISGKGVADTALSMLGLGPEGGN